MAKIDVKELILKILPVILPAIVEAVPGEKVGVAIKEKVTEMVGQEGAVIACEVLAKLVEEVAQGLRQ